MNKKLQKLQPYPFERLNALKNGIVPPEFSHIALSVGEPKHDCPDFVLDILAKSLDHTRLYPKTKGLPELRQAISFWLEQRFQLETESIDPEAHVLPVNGTREALFAFVQACVSSDDSAKVLMPNPFYQIYEGACYMAGAEPVFMNCLPDNGFLPDFDTISEQTWQDCQLLILCSPGNPTGAVIPEEQLQTLIQLADRYNFIIASDECYSEIYFDESNPPPGLLGACRAMGRHSYERCIVFHSLSKRSNLPGLRSGFVAGDANIMKDFLLYRTYHGCAMPEANQLASIAAWQDEQHVIENRKMYQDKFTHVLEILDGCLDVSMPEGAFYLWPKLPEDGEQFCKKLFAEQHITALPGQYLSRTSEGINPGVGRCRIALVASEGECITAAERIKNFMRQHYN